MEMICVHFHGAQKERKRARGSRKRKRSAKTAAMVVERALPEREGGREKQKKGLLRKLWAWAEARQEQDVAEERIIGSGGWTVLKKEGEGVKRLLRKKGRRRFRRFEKRGKKKGKFRKTDTRILFAGRRPLAAKERAWGRGSPVFRRRRGDRRPCKCMSSRVVHLGGEEGLVRGGEWYGGKIT